MRADGDGVKSMKVVLIGAGNLATNVGKALKYAGHDIVQVYSRTMSSAEALASVLGAVAVNDAESLRNDGDVYLLAVKDSVLASLIPRICAGREGGVFAHTAGSMSIDLFRGYAEHYGVFYPMQTFSKERAVDFRNVTCFIESSDPSSCKVLEELARSITPRVMTLSSEDRKYLHLAAVFACNFANHCFALSERLLASRGIGFDVMLPLVDEMVSKVHALSPRAAQTGPAVRNDSNVMEEHLRLLDDDEKLQEIYRLLSDSIREQ